MFKSKKIKENLYWVGVLDHDIKVFDVIMRTDYGTNYNAYIYKTSEKTVLVEVSKNGFFEEFIQRVSDVCDPKSIDYVILNHSEPDHSGALYKLLELNPDITVVSTNNANKNLKKILNIEFNSLIVKDGDTLDIGDGKNLKFIDAPFLHWPDSMLTYAEEDKIIFTCDFLGCHFCTEALFNDLETKDFSDAYKYYFDVIMSPFKSFVISALDKMEKLDFDMVLTGHGPILRENIPYYMNLYRKWATVEKNAKPLVVIPIASCYGHTAEIGESIKQGLLESGDIDVQTFDLVKNDITEIKAALDKADGILFGSATVLSDTLPPVWELLAHLNPIIHRGKMAGAFGSYGWSGESVANIEARLKQLRFKIPVEGIKFLFKPNSEEKQKAVDFGKAFGTSVSEAFKKN